MAIEIRQQLKLSQQLVMTPQLQQAIKLLQLSRMELIDMEYRLGTGCRIPALSMPRQCSRLI